MPKHAKIEDHRFLSGRNRLSHPSSSANRLASPQSREGRYSQAMPSVYARPTRNAATGGVIAPVSRQVQLENEAAKYRRSLYVNLSKSKKKIFRKKVLFCVGTLILALFVVMGGVAWGYAKKLDAALAPDSGQVELTSQVSAPVENGEPFYMLLLGSDSREGSGTSKNPAMQGDQQRSDVMILLRVDASNRQLTMLSIPRDTPYRLDDGTVVKINEAYNINGAAGSIEAVAELTGVPISHYAEVHFSEFQAIVDTLGGVTVNVPVEMSYKDALTGEKVTIQPGEQTLNGQQAQIFVRSRKVYEGNQDAHRQDNVRVLLNAIIDKVFDRPVSELPSLVIDLAEYATTDLKTFDLISLASDFAMGEGKMTIYSGTGPTDGAINDEAGGLWLCYEDPEGWAELMAVVDSGGNPKDVGK